jgi:DNA-binding NtrC family response regulator
VVDDDAQDLEAYSSSLRQEGFEVRAFVSYPEGLSCLESEHFDLVIVKLRKVPSLEDEKFWSVRSRSPAAGLSWFWQAVSIGVVTLMWCTWELWSN